MRIRARRVGAQFVPRFYDEDPLFSPIRPMAERFASFPDWPTVADYNDALADTLGPMRFVPAQPRGRRPRTVDAAALYDGAITTRHEIPTRPRSWHDFMNALVWATFPRAKLALHRRQHLRIAARLVPTATQLPAARTPELDALAMIDEAGVLDVGRPILFGHALYEALVLGEQYLSARTITLAEAGSLDDALAAALTDDARFTSPDTLGQFSWRAARRS